MSSIIKCLSGDQNDVVMENSKRKIDRTRHVAIVLLSIFITSLSFVAVYSIFIAAFIRFTHDKEEKEFSLYERSIEISSSSFASTHERIAQLINTQHIGNNSKDYSEYPHPPGSYRNELIAHVLAKQWKDFGFDKTDMFKYRVLLSFPEKPAEIYLREMGSDFEKKLVITNEKPFSRSERKGNPILPFHAFSVSGRVTGEVVFVNYGQDEDYRELKRLKVELKNKIFLLKYGTTHPRSHLLHDAHKCGAIGVIFYSDPYDYTYPGEDYPHGWMLNKHGVQRGTIYELEGDALSIGYPSKEHYYRDKPSTYKYSFPDMPSQPISAETAAEIIKFMEDDSISLPKSFKGGLNVTYVLQSGKNRQISLDVKNKLEDKDAYVVCGSLYGSEEPDRYVILGNHRDAWTYGASDPVSGGAVMTEIVRVLGKSKTKFKYRPRRSIMVCSWGAEEPCVLGSTEWADENANFLSTSAVAYLNVDQAVEGNFTVAIKSLDHMAPSILEAARHVPSSDNVNVTLFEDMRQKQALSSNMTQFIRSSDYYKPPGTVSDNKRFFQRYGVSTSDYRYTYNKRDFPRLIAHNGHYHTLYDSFDWMKDFVDPRFEHHAVLGKLWLKHALTLADSVIIPFDLSAYVRQVRRYFLLFDIKYKTRLTLHNISLTFAKNRIKTLVVQTIEFHEAIRNTRGKLGPLQIRAINDRIMHFEKNFILESLAGSEKLKHVIYSSHENFNGIVSAITTNPGEDWNNVRREITLLVWCVDMAIASLDLSHLRLSSRENL